MAGADAAALADPGDRLHFGVLADQAFGAAHKLCAFQLLIGQVTRNAHELFLPLQQPQAHTLLRVFHVTP